MKKNKLTKKLVLNKKTVSNLQDEEMNLIRGASVLFLCTESCSVLVNCCDPTSIRTCPPPTEKAIG